MTGKWDLARRSENSDAPRVTSTRRKNERALGEIELTRDLLHLIRREPFGFWQHSQLIPAEASFGKHVADCGIGISHSGFSASTPALTYWSVRKRQILDTEMLDAG